MRHGVTQIPNSDPMLALVFSFREGKSSDAEESFLGPAVRAGLGAGAAWVPFPVLTAVLGAAICRSTPLYAGR